MPKWDEYDAPHGTCDKCGWTGYDWAFKYQGLCSKCYKEWKRAKRERLRRIKPPNDNLEITKGVVVTRNVKERLEKQSESETPPVKHPELIDWSGTIAVVIVAIFLICFNNTKNPVFLVGLAIVIAAGILIEVNKHKKDRERTDAVNSHVKELAIQRKERIEEARLFYTSAEWRLIREKVIKQQGKVCQECRQTIKDAVDITVDHIKPRSKYPEEALKLDNLRVLCRSCNSQKGDDLINESDV